MLFGHEIKVEKIDKATMGLLHLARQFLPPVPGKPANYKTYGQGGQTNFGEKRHMLRNLENGDYRLVLLSKRIIMLTHEFEEALPYQKRKKGGRMIWWRKSTEAFPFTGQRL